jgi:hypothetical protein
MNKTCKYKYWPMMIHFMGFECKSGNKIIMNDVSVVRRQWIDTLA